MPGHARLRASEQEFVEKSTRLYSTTLYKALQVLCLTEERTLHPLTLLVSAAV